MSNFIAITVPCEGRTVRSCRLIEARGELIVEFTDGSTLEVAARSDGLLIAELFEHTRAWISTDPAA